MTTTISLDIKPCPAPGDGVPKWVYYAACRAVELGMTDEQAVEIIETMMTRPKSPYAASKLAGEAFCLACWSSMSVPAISLRYFNVYGPGQDPESEYAAVVPRFVMACLTGARPTIHGDGEQSRDFTFVADVVQANLLAAAAPGVSGRVYNVACGRRTSLLELVALLNGLLGTNIAPKHAAPRLGDVKHSQATIERAREDLGYRPTTDMKEGLRRCLEWWERRGDFHGCGAHGPIESAAVR